MSSLLAWMHGRREGGVEEDDFWILDTWCWVPKLDVVDWHISCSIYGRYCRLGNEGVGHT